MACQTGIRASEPLRRFFAKCKEGNVRVVKVVVKNEELTLNFHEAVSGDWERDFQRSLPHCLDAYEPCYVLFRLDARGSYGYEWLLISFADDSAPIRDKMLLAATRATLKAEFGQCYIRQEYHATSKEDCSLEGYRTWMKRKSGPAPLTDVERELVAAHEEEVALQERQKTANSLASQTLRGIAFPVDQEAQEKLDQLRRGGISYVQLSVDTLNEAIKLERFEAIGPQQLAQMIPKDKPRYHFFRYPHTYEGDNYDSLIFIYSLPSSGCSIKERMLFSSCKGPFLDTAERFIGLKPDRKIEIDSTEVVTDEYLLDQLHPKVHLAQQKFAKPKGPPGRGVRRITKHVTQPTHY
uniref:Twinfilin n=2 Tax=Plectus sambesii TaxID=2011161 RepID=A0A914W446_9BILA